MVRGDEARSGFGAKDGVTTTESAGGAPDQDNLTAPPG